MLTRSASVILSASEDGYVAYDMRRDRLYRLNPTAALIVELCDGTRDRAQLRHDLQPAVGSNWTHWNDWLDTVIDDQLLLGAAPNEAAAPVDTATAHAAGALARRADDLQCRDRVLAAFVCQQRADELAPDDPAMARRLGELAHIVGRRDEARRAYGRYLASCPDDAEVAHLMTALTESGPPPRVSDRCLTQLYERFAPFYDENMIGELDYCAPERLHHSATVALGPRGDLDVLDLGCGTGLNGVQWRPQARRLVGVDLSEPMVARARARRRYDTLETAEITAWLAREPTERFDVIVACDTLIYFGDLAQVVEPARRHLAPGGIVAFSVERGETDPFTLSDSGRFTHHPDHVARVVATAGLTLVSLDETCVRYEYGEPVTALLPPARRRDA